MSADAQLERLRKTVAVEDREREIAMLIVSVARPLAARVLARHANSDGLTRDDAEDIVSTVSLRLVTKLRAMTQSPEETIHHFEDYVATLTFNALSDHFRKRFPQRTRLKNRLRYTIGHDPRLALWTCAERLVCGLTNWHGNPGGSRDRVGLPEPALRRMRNRERPAEALVALFETCGEPLPFDIVVDTLAEVWQIVDVPPPAPAEPVDAQPQALAAVESRELLAAVWREVVQLRPMQRKALLFNLRDAETSHVLGLFLVTGVASLETLAAALEMNRSELEALWNDLPLDDLTIAARLQVTRQQVINLRKSARERLTRRLAQKKAP